MLNRRRGSMAIVSTLAVGLIGLYALMQRPRFALIQTVDVLQLLASGMCFGVALVGLVTWLRNRSAEKSGKAAE